MVTVKFVKQWTPYNEGEIATFSEAQAELLLRIGVAEIPGKLAPGRVVDIPETVNDTPELVTGGAASAPVAPAADGPTPETGKKGKRGIFGK